MNRHLLSGLATVAVIAVVSAPGAAAQNVVPELESDVDFVIKTITASHPAMHSELGLRSWGAMSEGMKHRQVSTPLEAWRELARLNPLFADAHMFVGFADWRAETAAHLAADGTLFPFEVAIDQAGTLTITSALGGTATELAGARILTINGLSADRTTQLLLDRMHGDTPRFRANLLGQRWWLYHWKMFGAAPRYRLTVARGLQQWQLDVPGRGDLPATLRDESDVTRLFTLSTKPGCTAVMRVGSFDGAHRKYFTSFTQAAFAQLRKEAISTLVIDISANGGGDDSLWLEGLMPYLATQPYRTGSSYVKRVVEANAERGEAVGQVVHGAIETWHAPQSGHPLLFKGKVYVRIGPSTYSSAVLFANVMHDFGFGTLVGEGGTVRRAQSGGVRKWTLPHSQLAVWAPRFVLQPPVPAASQLMLESERPWDPGLESQCGTD